MAATTIHQRIKQRREALGMSMTELTLLCGAKAWQTVQQWENGSTAPSRVHLPAVAKALGVTEAYLAVGADPVASPLAKLIADAQAILAAADDMRGPSKADTIKALNDLLRGPLANAALSAVEVAP